MWRDSVWVAVMRRDGEKRNTSKELGSKSVGRLAYVALADVNPVRPVARIGDGPAVVRFVPDPSRLRIVR